MHAADGVAVGAGVGRGVAVGRGVGRGVAVGRGVGVAVGRGVAVGMGVGVAVGVAVAVGSGVAVAVGSGLGGFAVAPQPVTSNSSVANKSVSRLIARMRQRIGRIVVLLSAA